MNENKNELMLWVGILAIIGIFIFFMPDIERAVFGRAKRDKEAGQSEVKKEDPNKEQKNINPKKEEKVTIPSKYECSRTTTESFYKEDLTYNYSYDEKGNTVTAIENMTLKVDNVESYNQMKSAYEQNKQTIAGLGEEFNKYYVINTEYDDANRIIKLTTNINDYAKAEKALNDYKKTNNELFELNMYKTYNETEINMKSDGYTCK